MDLKEIFDLSKMSEQDIGELEFVVNSPAYRKFFRGYMLKMRESAQRLLLDRSQARKDVHPDDGLAYQILFIDGLMAFLDGILDQTNIARMVETQQHTPQDEYEALRERNLIRHSGQTVDAADLQDAIDRELAEDF